MIYKLLTVNYQQYFEFQLLTEKCSSPSPPAYFGGAFEFLMWQNKPGQHGHGGAV